MPKAMGQPYALVSVDSPGRDLDRAFTYAMPEPLRHRLQVGSYVIVPFGKRQLPGFVVGFTDQAPKGLRPIRDAFQEEPLFSAEQLELCRWMAEHYQCSLAEALRCVVPPGGTRRPRRELSLADPAGADRAIEGLKRRAPVQAKVLSALRDAGGTLAYDGVRRALRGKSPSGALAALIEKGLVTERRLLSRPAAPRRTVAVARLLIPPDEALAQADRMARRAPRQAELLAALAQVDQPAAVVGRERATARSLAARGLLALERTRARRAPPVVAVGHAPVQPPRLTGAQEEALARVRAALGAPPATILVHGVTGSGKTEVYLAAIAETLARGKQAIVLVPEISLTPQAIARFSARFGDRLALLHSRLGAAERHSEWQRLSQGEADIAVGARSAVFAPLMRLGLVVIDEEHETAYKQESAPRYHAREVALRRARQQSAVVLLGSATPALETYHQAELGHYQAVTLPVRIDERPLPQVRIVDMRGRRRDAEPEVFGEELAEAVEQRLHRQEQVMLFLNRRGFATFVMCRDCGNALRCGDCQVSLTFHARSKRLRCHHCGRRETPPDTCPACASTRVGYMGLGTERVEEALRQLFPEARPARMDRDATSRKGACEAILRRFDTGETNVLIGTQMIAKGLDFPGVTLVGVINADTGLNFPDFRAAERTFQLLTQVAGRAGRGDRPGEVIVQTYNPDHYAILAAREHDYHFFCQKEQGYRWELGYPPFARLVAFLIADRKEQNALDSAEALADRLIEMGWDDVNVLGPAPAPLARLKGIYRYHVLAKSGDVAALHQATRAALKALPRRDRQRITIDVDPISMM